MTQLPTENSLRGIEDIIERALAGEIRPPWWRGVSPPPENKILAPFWDKNPTRFASKEALREFAADNRLQAFSRGEKFTIPFPLCVHFARWGAYAFYPDGRAVAYWLKDEDA